MSIIEDRILSDLQTVYGILPISVCPVAGGYMNQKWRIDDGSSTYLLKRFSPIRYPSKKLDRLETALHRQKLLYAHGLSCPRVFDCGGVIIRRIPSGQSGEAAYMLMSFEDGTAPTPDSVTLPQMTAIGEQCAHMHMILASLDPTSDAYYPLDSAAIVKRLTDHRKALNAFPDFSFTPGLDSALASLDTAFFDALPRQLCHEDFSADNLLICGETAVILDFDRGQYSFPLHDVGRALMSLAFDGHTLRQPHMRAFAEGYRRHRSLSCKELADALRVTAACEIPWWIHPDYDRISEPKVHRFVCEIRYLMHIWNDISDIVSWG